MNVPTGYCLVVFEIDLPTINLVIDCEGSSVGCDPLVVVVSMGAHARKTEKRKSLVGLYIP